jgi:hypothetical protein
MIRSRRNGSAIVVATKADDRDPVEVGVAGPAPFASEHLASIMTFHLRQETEGRFVLVDVMLRHPPDDVVAMADALGCPIHTMSSWDGVRISRECWNLALRRRDPILRRVLETHADDILTRNPHAVAAACRYGARSAARAGFTNTSDRDAPRDVAT